MKAMMHLSITAIFSSHYCFTINFIIIISAECDVQCDSGYIATMNCDCELNDSCEAFTPCQNGGTCILDSVPDQFSCNCTNSYDPNTNCSGKYIL